MRENPTNVRVNYSSNHRCRAHSKGAQTVVGQHLAGNEPNGLSYNNCYYYYYYYYYILLPILPGLTFLLTFFLTRG